MREPRGFEELINMADETGDEILNALSASEQAPAVIVQALFSCTADIIAAIERASIPDPKRVRFHGVDIHDLIPLDRDWTSEDDERIERVSGHKLETGDHAGLYHEKRECTR